MISAITLIAATLTMGFAAGVFVLFAHTIMPGLRTADDRTFVDAFQRSFGDQPDAINQCVTSHS